MRDAAPTTRVRAFLLAGAGVLALLAMPAAVDAQALRERLPTPPEAPPPVLPAGARLLADLAYGDHPRQRYDVYLPADARAAPIVLFVHGGGWAFGDKRHAGSVQQKAGHWLAKGYVLVSSNYRLRPQTPPLEQARDIARALASVQARAAQWHADPDRVVLVGHSAGAHLAVLVGAAPALWREAGARRPAAVVSLDSGALDVPELMRRPRIPPLYRRAFGDDPQDWIAASPQHRLDAGAVPMLLVCATRRPDACPQAEAMRGKGASLGVRIDVLPQDLSHAQLNRLLGVAPAYTTTVDRFVKDAFLEDAMR